MIELVQQLESDLMAKTLTSEKQGLDGVWRRAARMVRECSTAFDLENVVNQWRNTAEKARECALDEEYPLDSRIHHGYRADVYNEAARMAEAVLKSQGGDQL